MMKEDTFQSRRDAALEAKQKLLQRFKVAAADPEADRRKAERAKIVEAREARMRAKAEEERRRAAERAAEEARIAAEKEAERAAAEAAKLAARPKAINAAAYALAARFVADTASMRRKSA